MCTPSTGVMLPYGLKIPSPYFPFGHGNGVNPAHISASLDFQRNQINDYNVRIQLGIRNYQHSLGLSPFHAYLSDPYAQAYFYKHDPRARFVQEEPKPSHSYIGLIGMAILNSKEKKLVLSDIYQWILDNYSYFRTRGPGWRNSIRHNLSLNDCFIKSGRSANGKGHYWAVHPANVDDFERGDFRRRRAQRKVRRHMGLSVPDDDDSPSPSPQPWARHDVASPDNGDRSSLDSSREDKREGGSVPGSVLTQSPDGTPRLLLHPHHPHHHLHPHSHHQQQPVPAYGLAGLGPKKPSRKRLFDMASLLAPDEDDSSDVKMKSCENSYETMSRTVGNRDSDTIVKNEDNSSDGDGPLDKYSEEDDRVLLLKEDPYDKHNNMSEDERECDDDIDDDDTGEEIHVTSDDERPTKRPTMSDHNDNNNTHNVSVECDKYSETGRDSSAGVIYREDNKDISHEPKDNQDSQNSNQSDIISGIRDKENILRAKINEMYSKSNYYDNTNSLFERNNTESPKDQQKSSSPVSRYHSPDAEHEARREINLSPSQERLLTLPPSSISDRLGVPLTIAINSSNFPYDSNLLRRPPSDPREANHGGHPNSLLFQRSAFKNGEISRIAEMKHPRHINVNCDVVLRNNPPPPSDHSPVQMSVDSNNPALRLSAEALSNWQQFQAKNLIRDRFGSFNVLEGRQPGLLNPFHQGLIRGIPPFTPQSLLAHGVGLGQGIAPPSPLPSANPIPVSANTSPGSSQHND